jgi:predicted metal-dependent HD superfamily phosphohydrolase
MDAAGAGAMHDRWNALSARVGAFAHAADADVTFDMVTSLYATPRREHHNLDHIAACLAVFDGVRMLAEDRDAVEFALWMHDAVYQPERPDNEARSADAAGMIAALLGCAPDFVERVRGFILATRHDGAPAPGDAALVADIDLAELGGEWGAYDRYTQRIRREFGFASDEMFAQGRAAFLERMLAKKWVYATGYFRKEFEARARENMARELEELTG